MVDEKHLKLDYYFQMKDKTWFREYIGRCEGCGKLAFRIPVGYTCGDISVELYLCNECFKKFFFDPRFQAKLVRKKIGK